MNAPTEPPDSRWTTWVEQHEHEDVATLALRYSGKPGLPLRFLLQQIKGRQVARQKFPSWYACSNILYPDSLSLEQCSSEVTARFKAQFVQGLNVADLTGGLGIDTWAFSQTAKSVFYNEPDGERVNAAMHNMQALGCTNIHFRQLTAEEVLQQGLSAATDFVYLDPSRRDSGGRKVFLLQDLQPDVLSLKKKILEQAGRLLIKLSPMFDLHEGFKLLPETTRVDILSWKGDCREMLFHLEKCKDVYAKHPLIVCAELDSDLPEFRFEFDSTADAATKCGKPKAWLYEPHAAVRKSGAWSLVGNRFGMETLHPNTHLFTSDHIEPDFPGRRFRILDTLNYRPTEILERLDHKSASMVFYNFPVPAKKVIAQLPIPSGEPFWLFFVTLDGDHPAVLLTEKGD